MDGVLLILSIRNCAASIDDRSARARRSRCRLASSSGVQSSSSRRVPDFSTSTAGKIRRSAIDAVEDELHVPGALELLEDDLVHAAAGVHERGGQDGEAADALAVACRAEELTRELQGAVVDAARHGAPAGSHLAVGRAAQPRERVQQDHHVPARLDHALRALHGELGQADVRVSRGVRGRRQDLGGDRAAEVRDLLRPLVDEQQDEVDLGMVLADGHPRCSSSVVLPALGGDTMSPRWPRPMGAIRSITRRLVSAPGRRPPGGTARWGLQR